MDSLGAHLITDLARTRVGLEQRREIADEVLKPLVDRVRKRGRLGLATGFGLPLLLLLVPWHPIWFIILLEPFCIGAGWMVGTIAGSWKPIALAAEYLRAVEPAETANDAAVKAANQAYHAVIDPAREKFEQAKQAANRVYRETLAPVEAEYESTVAAARSTLDQAKAEAKRTLEAAKKKVAL